MALWPRVTCLKIGAESCEDDTEALASIKGWIFLDECGNTGF
jgi:hypothetical protein